MWSLTSDDIERARDRARQRRAELEERYAAERKEIDAECAEIEAFERIAAEFSSKHALKHPAAPAAPAGEAAPQKPAESQFGREHANYARAPRIADVKVRPERRLWGR